MGNFARFAQLSTILLTLQFENAAAREIELEIVSQKYTVELAVTPAQRQLGLMHRENLPPGHGMLLVYSRVGDHRVWMKNMRIALRVYWIDASHRVIHRQRLVPCTESPCPVFAAPSASRFILELDDREHGIATGDPVRGLNGL